MRPERIVVRLHVGGEPRHLDVDQQPDIGLRDRVCRREAGKAWTVMRDIARRVRLEHGDTGELREFLDHLRRAGVASGVAGDQDRIFRRDEPLGERRHHLRIGAAGGRGAEPVGRIAADLVHAPVLSQRLALHHQINRPARLALHDRMRPLQRLFDDNAGRKRPLPLQIGPHQARLIERLLHPMHVGIARADQFAVRGKRRLAGHQQDRQATAEQVVHRVRGIGGADVDVNDHALTAPGDQSVASRHVRSGVLVRTADDLRHRLAKLAMARHLLDDRRVIGAEITEQIIYADLGEAFEQVMGRGICGNIVFVRDRRIHLDRPFGSRSGHFSIASSRAC